MIGVERLLDIAQLGLSAVAVAAGFLALLDLRGRMRPLEGQLYVLSMPPSTATTEQVFMHLHALLRSRRRRLFERQPWISLEIVGRARQVTFQVWIPRGQKMFVETLLQAAYPGIALLALSGPASSANAAEFVSARLALGNYLPIATSFTGEPLIALLATLARVDSEEEACVQLLVRPKSARWQMHAHMEAQRLRRGRGGSVSALGQTCDRKPTQFERSRAKAIEDKAGTPAFDCVLRIAATARRPGRARELAQLVSGSFGLYVGVNRFDFRSTRRRGLRKLFALRQFPLFGGFVLSARELSGLWHVPSEVPPHLRTVRSPQLPPPVGAQRGERVLGVSTWAGEQRRVGLSIADSRYHLHLLGSTGTGKTTALLSLAAQDIAAGRGVGVLDPKGDLVRGLLARIPRARLDDVVLISPEEAGQSVGINPLELWPGDDRDLVADNALTIFKRIYERYWGPRTDDVLRSALLTILRRPDPSLAHIPLLLTDAAFRRQALADVQEPFALDGFWTWFEKLSETQRVEVTGPVLNKLRDFLVRPRLRRLLCQPRSTIDLRRVVDSSQILLADLSVGRWGESFAALIGSFLVAKIWQAVLARSAIAEEERSDFFLFVDEFQHFLGVAGPFADVLAEARSLRLSLTIANQHLGQLTRELRESIASNARSHVVFQCGQDDAAYLAREFAPLDAPALMSLARFETAARLCIDGGSSRAFTMRTLPPPAPVDVASPMDIRRRSSERFARPVESIDGEMAAAVGLVGDERTTGGRRRRS